jgi:hypothetical protein
LLSGLAAIPPDRMTKDWQEAATRSGGT